MTPAEATRLEAFLQPAKIAVVATIGRHGMPQLTPNWYNFADGTLTISTTKETEHGGEYSTSVRAGAPAA